jgi:type I restriction enzyme R subunit
MSHRVTESTAEEACLDWLSELGFTILHGPAIAPCELAAERQSFQEVILPQRLREALSRLNPGTPVDTLDEAARKLTRTESPSLVHNNRAFHRMLINGVDVSYQAEGRIVHEGARLIDFENPDSNDWVAVNQFTVIEGHINRRPDIVLFVNGIPLVVIELKNPADENATIWTAFNQLQTYKQQIPSLFTFNEALVVSDGLETRIGSITADKERYFPWRTIEGEELAPALMPQLEVLVKGIFEKKRFLRYIRHFIVFEEEKSGEVVKKIAGYISAQN